MRGTARRAVVVNVPAFGWDRAVVAMLRHSTLPWHEEFAREIDLDAAPIASLSDLGSRDRLSLTGQFAAHLAFLQFAGVADAAFDPMDWVVVRKRGSDCRLVRIAARNGSEEMPPLLTLIQQFASAVGAPPLDVLRQSWARAETVYHEIESKLRAGAAADLRWLHWAATGAVAGASGLEALRALARLDESIVILGDGASPLIRYSAIRGLGLPHSLDEHAIVERLAGSDVSRKTFVIVSPESFDESSRRVVDLLKAAGVGVWPELLEETKTFLLSPVLRAMPSMASRERLETFVQSAAFARYLDEGELPVVATENVVAVLREPLRSFIAAVALFGQRTPKKLVDVYLERLRATVRAADLVTAGVCSLDDEALSFASEDVRRQAIDAISIASRPSLCRTAAEVCEAHGDRRRAASLLLDCGDVVSAAALFESIDWPSSEEAIRSLRALPRAALSVRHKSVLAEALFATGRFRDAREFASEPLLARIERRTGEYASALTRLESLDHRDFDSELLRAEILLLLDRSDEARSLLDQSDAATDDQRAHLAFQRAILDGGAADIHNAYLSARIGVYRAIAAKDRGAAVAAARQAISSAAAIQDRVDATLDLIFALFCSGDWAAARAAALDALLLVDQTQGDRAAGGILFTLAYLAADDGQWTHAAHLVERLRGFYGEVRDEKRLAELDMLSATIDFSRGRFAAAARAAHVVLSSNVSDQIRETAALIADEIDWIEHRKTQLRSTGTTANLELANRHALIRARRGLPHSPLQPFAARLLAWEDGGPLPEARNGSEKLMLYRTALRYGRNNIADRIATELHTERDHAPDPAFDSELRILRSAAALPFPFDRNDFRPACWRFATRNRLGQWQEFGSMAGLSGAELDAVLVTPPADWIACSERELLYIDGLSEWSAGSREAIASLFRVRADHHRLRRLLDEETLDGAHESIEGIVGESPSMREIYELISRVARRDVPVCILGESGTGKELVARAVHRQSSRRHKLFTPINCAALPENLIENELFGHARGAFTGADRDRSGLIETTDGGTLFLDEIGEMPLVAQAKLLRFLQEGEFRRVGETTNRSADVRVLTATNRKLEAAVEQGRFREDLYYRIRGIEIVLPPLRDRTTDIPLLASHFLAAEKQKHRTGPSRLSAEAISAFGTYHWPGNVRELQNTIRAAHALAGDAREIDLEHLPERVRGIKIVRGPVGSYQHAVARFRRELIEKSLLQSNGNQNQAAAMLEISRQALAYQIRELGILVKPIRPTRT